MDYDNNAAANSNDQKIFFAIRLLMAVNRCATGEFKALLSSSGLPTDLSESKTKRCLLDECFIDLYGDTPLHAPAKHNHDEIMELLIEHSASLNCKHYSSCREMVTPLHEAVRLLLTKGADDVGALCVAARHNHIDIMELLIERGVNVNCQYSTPCCELVTPLHEAVRCGHEEAVRWLLSRGADVGARDSIGCTPFHIAIFNKSLRICTLMIESATGIDIVRNGFACEQFTRPISTYFNTASFDSGVPQFLIEHGLDVNARGTDGETHLHAAAADNDVALVDFLLNVDGGSGGVDIELQDNDGRTPLFLACVYNHTASVQMLLDAGANPDVMDRLGLTPLHVACTRNYISVVELLFQYGADVNRILLPNTSEFLSDKIRCIISSYGSAGVAKKAASPLFV